LTRIKIVVKLFEFLTLKEKEFCLHLCDTVAVVTIEIMFFRSHSSCTFISFTEINNRFFTFESWTVLILVVTILK